MQQADGQELIVIAAVVFLTEITGGLI